MESDAYFTPCYHYQHGMTYPHNQEICDHVPDIACSSDLLLESFQNVYYPQNYYHQEQPFNNHDCFNNYSRSGNDEFINYGVDNDKSNADEPIKKIYEEISKECEHFLLKETCNQCQKRSVNVNEPEEMVKIFLDDDEMTKLALSMKRKREQNRRAAVKYREKKKESLNKAFSEIEQLEERQNELLGLIDLLSGEIAQCRRTLNLPVSN